MEGILIGTAILWVATAVIVIPLTNLCVSCQMKSKGVHVKNVEELSNQEIRYWKKTATIYYILLDVIILGIVGFIGGILGFYFLGFSTEAKSWPGMLVFVGASFLGLSTNPTL